MKKALLAASALIGLGAGLVGWRAHRRAERARSTIAALYSHRHRLDTEQPAVNTRSPQPAASEASTLRSATRSQANAAVAGAGKPTLAMSLEAYPNLRAVFRKSFQADLEQQYRAFFDAAHLTPDEIRRFEKVMTDAEETKMDFEIAARAQGLSPTDPSLAPLRAAGATELKAALQDALGEDGFRQLEQFRRIQPVAPIVADVSRLVAQTPTPLDAAQGDRLMKTLANASPAYQTGHSAKTEDINWPQVLIEAQSYLSPGQITVLRQERDMQQVYAMLWLFYGGK